LFSQKVRYRHIDTLDASENKGDRGNEARKKRKKGPGHTMSQNKKCGERRTTKQNKKKNRLPFYFV